MSQQWKKLSSLILLLLFGLQSTLLAEACPCCAYHLLRFATTEGALSPQAAALDCCPKGPQREKSDTPSCCKIKEISQSAPPQAGSVTSCDTPDDCQCCSRFPSDPVISHPTTTVATVLHSTAFIPTEAFLFRWEATVDLPEVPPPPLNRRLAILSFWRN